MGRGNAELSAKNSEEHKWKTQSGLGPSLTSTTYMKAHKKSTIHITLQMRSFQDKGSPANARIDIWEIHRLSFLVSIYNLQSSHMITIFFSPGDIRKDFTKISFLPLQAWGIRSTWELETELVCWQYPKQENTFCLNRGMELPRIIMNMHAVHQTR